MIRYLAPVLAPATATGTSTSASIPAAVRVPLPELLSLGSADEAVREGEEPEHHRFASSPYPAVAISSVCLVRFGNFRPY